MPKVLVVGDLILDIYHFGSPLKDSVEGLQAIREKTTEISLGGAGLLVRNILALYGRVSFISRVGDDEFGKFAQDFKNNRLEKFFIQEANRKTTVKERFVVSGKKVLKWNHLDERGLSAAGEKKIVNFLKKNLRSFDKIVISDYRHGLISKSLAKTLVNLGKKARRPVYVDSQIAQQAGNHGWYRGADLICFNIEEAKSVDRKFNLKNLKSSLSRAARILNIPNVVVKLGKRGSAALSGGKLIFSRGYKVKAIDPTGAGDAFFAVLCLASFPPIKEDLKMANIWAGLSATISGTKLPNHENFSRAVRKNW